MLLRWPTETARSARVSYARRSGDDGIPLLGPSDLCAPTSTLEDWRDRHARLRVMGQVSREVDKVGRPRHTPRQHRENLELEREGHGRFHFGSTSIPALLQPTRAFEINLCFSGRGADRAALGAGIRPSSNEGIAKEIRRPRRVDFCST